MDSNMSTNCEPNITAGLNHKLDLLLRTGCLLVESAADTSRLIADSTAARKILGWNPQYQDLETIVRSAWDWKQAHPLGYNDR